MANNPYANKVLMGDGTVLIDLTGDTVAANKMLSGVTAHDKSGALITGSIQEKTGSDLSASGATVTVPAGHYASQVTKDVASGSATTPATSLPTTGAISISVSDAGVITAEVESSATVVPTVVPGYVSGGTGGTVSIQGSAQESLSTQAGATITPSRTEQTAVAAQKFTTGAVKVAPIPDSYHTLEEIYTIGSLWATYDGTVSPAEVLGFGTWLKVSPIQPTWNRLKETSTWASMQVDEPMIFVWKRTE